MNRIAIPSLALAAFAFNADAQAQPAPLRNAAPSASPASAIVSSSTQGKFMLRQVRFSPTKAVPADELQALVKPFVGREVDATDLAVIVTAVRRAYESWGYGPGYKLPGTSHRTGHGIGMEGHEPVNLVHGETTPLAPGMCFSNEPGIYIPGKWGVRLEDCFHMTASGPKWFTVPPPSIDRPFD